MKVQKQLSLTRRPMDCFETGLVYTSSVILHEHDSHELFFCKEGPCLQHTQNGTYEMQAGELYFFPAGQLHIGSLPERGACVAHVVNLHVKSFLAEAGRDEVAHHVLAYLTEQAWRGQPRVMIQPEAAAKVGALFERMVKETQLQPAGYASALRIYMMEAMLTILRDPAVLGAVREHFRPNPAKDRLGGVLQYIETNYMNPLDVARLARLACVSRSHFHAVFKQQTGQTLVEYITGVRIRYAMDLLRNRNQPILAVAQSCGFASLSHFYHCFKALVGQTPREYAIP